MKPIGIPHNHSPKKLARLKHALFNILGTKWEVRQTIWPYEPGWGVYNPSTRTIANHGLSYTKACEICDELNGGKQ